MGRLARSLVAGLLGVALTVVALVTWLRRRTRARVREIPFSRCQSVGVVGADWAARSGHAGDPVPGEVEDFGTFSRAEFDAAAVHPEVTRFYEQTAAYDMAYTVEWHGGFRPGAWLAAFATSRLLQLNLPGRSTDEVRHLRSRLERVPDDVDPRDSVVWTRTDPDSGEAIFVAVYGRHRHRGVTYANVAVPLPWSNLSTVLRPEAIEGDDEGTGVEFTTAGPGDGGLYLITPLGPVALPLSQSFRVWPASAPGAPAAPVAGADLVATHEMWLCGRQFLTVTYGMTRADADREGASR
jgi:hypothetical protein